MTKNLLTPAVHAKMYNTILIGRSLILLCIVCFSSIQVLAQKEKLVRKGLGLNDVKEPDAFGVFADKKIIFPALDPEISRNSISGLWLTDGSDAGTTIVKEFDKESGESFFFNYLIPSRFFNFNNKVFMNIGHNLVESDNYLYVSDGTDSGTFKLLDSKVAKSIYAVYHSKLYISNDKELLTSDGTKAGTQKVAISEIPEITNLFKFNDYLIIETVSGLYSYNDQTRVFTLLSDNSNPAVVTKNYIFFVGKDGDLWKTNGTPAGTSTVINITDGADIRRPDKLIATNKYVVFASYTDKTKNSSCLWFSDGNISAPMKDNKGIVVTTDTTGYSVLPTKFDEKIYFFLPNVREATNNYLYVFQNNTSSAKFLKNITGFEGNMFPYTPKVNNNQEYLYATPESSYMDGYMFIKGFNATTDSLITLTRIFTQTQTSWFKNGNQIYFSKTRDFFDSDLYVQSACNFDVKINAPDGTRICNENAVKLDLSIIKYGDLNGFNIKWDHAKGDPTQDLYKINAPGTYTVRVSDGTGCMISQSINITKSDNLSVSITGNNSFCPSQSTTLTTSIEEGIAPYTYQWKNGTNNTGANANTFNVNTAGNYSVLVKDSKGCQGIAPLFVVKEQALPDVRITKSSGTDIVSGGSTTLTVLSSANQTYQWFKGTASISGATSNTYTVKEPGNYSVTVNANGCSASSEIVIVSLVLANESIIEPILVEVFPNPTDNLIKLNITEPLKKTAQLSLLNMSGILIKKWETKQQDNILNLAELSAGQYLLKVDFNNQSATKKIIKLQ